MFLLMQKLKFCFLLTKKKKKNSKIYVFKLTKKLLIK
jgi:hypothetical protein